MNQSRRLAPVVLLLALLGAPAPAAAATAGFYQPGETTYTRSQVDLLEGDSRPGQKKVGQLPAGATVLLIQRWRGTNNKTPWWRVRSDGQEGWLPATSLTRLAPRPREDAAPAPPPASAPAPAAAPATTAEPAPRSDPGIGEIESAIARHEGRRRSAISGYVIGGVLIFGGVIKSAIDTDNEIDEKYERGDYSETSLDYTGIALGVLVAAPIFIVAVNTHMDANRELKSLYPVRSRLKLAPTADGGQVLLSLEFGGR